MSGFPDVRSAGYCPSLSWINLLAPLSIRNLTTFLFSFADAMCKAVLP